MCCICSCVYVWVCVHTNVGICPYVYTCIACVVCMCLCEGMYICLYTHVGMYLYSVWVLYVIGNFFFGYGLVNMQLISTYGCVQA